MLEANCKEDRRAGAFSALGYLVNQLDSALLAPTSADGSSGTSCQSSYEDIDAYSWIRKNVSIDSMRESGTFFTSLRMAEQALSGFVVNGDETILDPACGCGDLLIAVSKRLNVEATVADTLRIWGARLRGRDLHPELVAITKRRLIQEVVRRHGEVGWIGEADQEFPHVLVGDSLQDLESNVTSDLVLMNPPYGRVDLSGQSDWASGMMTEAAIFVSRSLDSMLAGQRLIAILPEVLRSGTNSKKWREMVQSSALEMCVRSIGTFDANTDVDVFCLMVIKGEGGGANFDWGVPASVAAALTVGDYFKVSVGPLVPYRDPEKGESCVLYDVRTVAAWDRDVTCSITRRFNGRTHSGPFVLVRRTSRVGQAYRAIASCVKNARRAAVENHLIVCVPNDGTIATCLHLLRSMKSVEANAWFDSSIRCRHLTVSSVRQMPYVHRV